MKYRESNKDKKLRAWFTADMSHALLRRIYLKTGSLRGVNSLDMRLEYPITAIAGKNGAGKSTILALACCAFHAADDGFKLPRRKNTYYTFSDFFVQHRAEVPPQGVSIYYFIAFNNWKPSEKFPNGVGIAAQQRHKSKGGKWNDYDTRVKRTVVFLGIERIVPHIERSQSRSYSKVFKDVPAKGWEDKVRDAVGQIVGKKYDDFRYVEHSKYSLPVVKCGSAIYSGFNMGAGENALFEIFSTIYSAGNGAMLVMDEIELGLHAEAQRRFVDKLKNVCLEMRTQVICTTHSKEIFDCLPHDGRFFVESVGGKTRITQGISSEFAFSKLSSIGGLELDLLVEDDTAKAILLALLPAQLRARSTLRVIGSASALSRQLAAAYARGEEKPVLAVFDGDQATHLKENLEHARKMAEKTKSDFDDWFHARVIHLPGDTWPELWLLKKASEAKERVAEALGTSVDDLTDILEYGMQAGKHNEMHEIARHVGLERDVCLQLMAAVIASEFDDEMSSLTTRIQGVLGMQ